ASADYPPHAGYCAARYPLGVQLASAFLCAEQPMGAQYQTPWHQQKCAEVLRRCSGFTPAEAAAMEAAGALAAGADAGGDIDYCSARCTGLSSPSSTTYCGRATLSIC